MNFFSILLPGALLTWLLMGEAGPAVLGAHYAELDGAQCWAAFLFASYLFGHLGFQPGSDTDHLGEGFTQQRAIAHFEYFARPIVVSNMISSRIFKVRSPDVVLHANGSESDIRGYVKWRKISGGTRSDLGKDCRDGFASLKKTCRKLGSRFGTIWATASNSSGWFRCCPT